MSPARHRQGATMQSTQPALTGQETERNRVYMKIGFTELLVVVIVAFVFIGPNQLPEYARKLGKMLRELRKYTSTASKDIQENIVEPLNEIQQPLKEAISPLTDIKKDIDNSVKDVTKSFTGIGKTSKEEAAAKAAAEEPVEELEELRVLHRFAQVLFYLVGAARHLAQVFQEEHRGAVEYLE